MNRSTAYSWLFGKQSGYRYQNGGSTMFRQFGVTELVIVLVIALLIFGPTKLPQLGRAIGKTIREFRAHVGGAKDEPEEQHAEDGPDSSPPTHQE